MAVVITPGVTLENVRRVRAYSGESMMCVKSALQCADGDLLLACGYLHYNGILVNRKGVGDAGRDKKGMATSYAALLLINEDGQIVRRDLI